MVNEPNEQISEIEHQGSELVKGNKRPRGLTQWAFLCDSWGKLKTNGATNEDWLGMVVLFAMRDEIDR